MTKQAVIRFIASLPPGEFRWIIGASRKAWAAKNGKPRKRLRLKLDTKDVRWSQDVRERDGHTCVYCLAGKDTGTSVQAAHIVPRRYLATRYDLLNGLSLCYQHHQWAHAEQSQFIAWVWEHYPGRARYLQQLVPTWKGWA